LNRRLPQGNMRAMLRAAFLTFLALLASAAATVPAAAESPSARVTGMRLWSDAEGTRLVIDLSRVPRHTVFTLENPHRIVVDLEHTQLAMPAALPGGQGVVQKVRTGPRPNAGLRVVLDLREAQQPKSFTVPAEPGRAQRLVIELPGAPTAVAVAAPAAQPAVAAPAPTEATPAPPAAASEPAPAAPISTPASASGQAPVKAVRSDGNGRTLVVAIDAGHGGKDPGAIGKAGTREKDVTLAVARRLAKLVNAEDGMRAVLIRDGDQFLSLRTRIRKAREAQADMFISVHADSALNREAKGSSVYVLSLRGASDEAARWLAERENAADLVGGVSLEDKNDVLASVLLDVTQEESLNSSIEAARRVLEALDQEGKLLRTRVQHAGFVVLKSPDIPSMLVETAFLSNAADERALRDPAHQQRLAAAIHRGVKRYFYDFPQPGTRVAALAARVNVASGGELRANPGP
jgi:N-acetylmuramoyl-L-alanine amidase